LVWAAPLVSPPTQFLHFSRLPANGPIEPSLSLVPSPALTKITVTLYPIFFPFPDRRALDPFLTKAEGLRSLPPNRSFFFFRVETYFYACQVFSPRPIPVPCGGGSFSRQTPLLSEPTHLSPFPPDPPPSRCGVASFPLCWSMDFSVKPTGVPRTAFPGVPLLSAVEIRKSSFPLLPRRSSDC